MRSLLLALMGTALLVACSTENVQRPGSGGELSDGAARAARAGATSASSPPLAPADSPEGGNQPISDERHGQRAARRATAKPAAPVDIDVHLGPRSAAVQIAFRADARDVAVKVWGTDGLEVQGNGIPISSRDFKQGERVTVDVPFSAPAGESHFAVGVSGVFTGRRQSKVQSFAVGGGAALAGGAGQPAPDERRLDAAGRAITILKAAPSPNPASPSAPSAPPSP